MDALERERIKNELRFLTLYDALCGVFGCVIEVGDGLPHIYSGQSAGIVKGHTRRLRSLILADEINAERERHGT